jgi:hypothetical protein
MVKELQCTSNTSNVRQQRHKQAENNRYVIQNGKNENEQNNSRTTGNGMAAGIPKQRA